MDSCSSHDVGSTTKVANGFKLTLIMCIWLLLGVSKVHAVTAPQSCTVPSEPSPGQLDSCHCDLVAPAERPDLPRCDGLTGPQGPQSPTDTTPPGAGGPPTDVNPPDSPVDVPGSTEPPAITDGPPTTDTPAPPSEPATPNIPVQPPEPTIPASTEQPAEPSAPIAHEELPEPMNTDTLEEPSEPTPPGTPVQTPEPTGPELPEQPLGPTSPGVPEQPSGPTLPASPELPTDPVPPISPNQTPAMEVSQGPEAPVEIDTPDNTDNPAVSPVDSSSSDFLFDFTQNIVDLTQVRLPERSLLISADSIQVRVEGKNAQSGTLSGGSAFAGTATPFQSAAMSLNFEGIDNPSTPIGDAGLTISTALYQAEPVESNDGEIMYVSVDFGQKDGAMQAWTTLWRSNGTERRELETQLLWSQDSNSSIEDAILAIDYDDDTTVTVTLGDGQTVLSGDARIDSTDTHLLIKTTLPSDSAASGTLMATVSQLTLNAEAAPDLTELFVAESTLTTANSVVSVDEGLLKLTAGTLTTANSSEAIFETTALSASHGFRSLSALLNIDGESASDGSVTGSAYLSANLFNDTYNGDWNLLEGDVVGVVGARLTADGSWQAFASLERLANEQGSISETIAYHEFPGILATDTNHAIFLNVNDESITFGMDELEHTVEFTGSRFAAWTSSTRLVADLESGQGSIAVTFDDLSYRSEPFPAMVDAQPPAEPLTPETGNQGIDERIPQTPALTYALAYSTHTIELFWSRSASDFVTSYEIYRDGQWVADVDATSWLDSNLMPDSEFEYHVLAKSATAVKSEKSAVATARTHAIPRHPNPPSDVKALRYSSNQVEIFWQRSSSTSPVIYEVERNGVQIARGDMLSTMDNNAPDDAEYFYEVFALDKAGRRSAGSGKLFLGKP